jgi:predicted nucleic acid-binding protein
MILLDTDVCLALLKGNTKVIDAYGSLPEEICVSPATAQELFYAANRSGDPVGNRITAEKFLLTVRILHPDLAVMKYAADVQHTLRKKGIAGAYQDVLLYSLSKVYGARLITTNGKRYCFT